MYLKKMLLASVMAVVLTFGFNQLAMGAALTCPVNACEDLFWCDVGACVEGPSCGTINGEAQYIYEVAKGTCGSITSCYANWQWGH